MHAFFIGFLFTPIVITPMHIICLLNKKIGENQDKLDCERKINKYKEDVK
jgi:hypothetical protein